MPPLNTCITNYIQENHHLWQERHRERILGILKQLPHLHLKKPEVSKLKSKWLKTKSIATVNKCFGYCSMFYRWLQTGYDGVENRFLDLRIKGHLEKPRKAYTIKQLDCLYRAATDLREKGMESYFRFLMIGRLLGDRMLTCLLTGMQN